MPTVTTNPNRAKFVGSPEKFSNPPSVFFDPILGAEKNPLSSSE